MGYVLHSSHAPNGNLVYGNITGALLSEESRCKTMGSSHHGEAHYVQKEGKQRQGRSKQRNDFDRDGKKDASCGRSKSRGGKKDIQCHFCDKFGHLKKDCYAWKREKGKSKDKGSSSASEDKPKSLVKIDELNVVTHTSDS